MALSFPPLTSLPANANDKNYTITISDPLSGYSFTATGVSSPAYFIGLNQSVTYNYTVTANTLTGTPISSTTGSVTMFPWTPSFYITFNDSTVTDLSNNHRTITNVGGTPTFLAVNSSPRIKVFRKTARTDPYFSLVSSIGATFTLSFWTNSGGSGQVGLTGILFSATGFSVYYGVSSAGLNYQVGNSTSIWPTADANAYVHHVLMYDGVHIKVYTAGLLAFTSLSITNWAGTAPTDVISIGSTMVGSLDDIILLNYATTDAHILAIFKSTSGAASLSPSQQILTTVPTQPFDVSVQSTFASPTKLMPLKRFNPGLGAFAAVTSLAQYACAANWTMTCVTGPCSGTSPQYTIQIDQYLPTGLLFDSTVVTMIGASWSSIPQGNTFIENTTQTISTNSPNPIVSPVTAADVATEGIVAFTQPQLYTPTNLVYVIPNIPAHPAVVNTAGTANYGTINSMTCQIYGLQFTQYFYYADQQIAT